MICRFVVACIGVLAVSTPATAQIAVEATQFVQRANKELFDLGIRAIRASWIQENFITEDTEALSAEVGNELSVAVQRLAEGAKRFDKVTVSPDIRRQLTLLKLAVVTSSA